MRNDELEKYLGDISASMVNELFSIIEGESKNYGGNFGNQLALTTVRNMVFVMVSESLNNVRLDPNASAEEMEDSVKLSYATMKDSLQNAIADGFEAASLKFSGQSLGYYCKVSTAGDPVNTLAI